MISGSTFTISSVASGATYAVGVTTQPTGPSQTCTVTSGGGTVGAGNVAGVLVTCTTNTYRISGTISGLSGTGLAIADTVSGHTAVITGGSSFTISSVTSGATYAVSVTTQPTAAAQKCTVANGTGTVTTMAITGVTVSCINVGQFLWVTNPFDNSGTGSVGAFTIDPSSGALTAVSGFPAATNPTTDNQPFAIVIDPYGQYVYVANNGATTPSANVATDSVNTAAGSLTQDVQSLSAGG